MRPFKIQRSHIEKYGEELRRENADLSNEIPVEAGRLVQGF